MIDRVFIDTNVLVYSSLKDKESNKHELAIDLLKKIQDNGDYVFISTQVIIELYKTLMRYKISDSKIQNVINSLLQRVELSIIDINVIKDSWKLRNKYNISYWDSLIVSSALNSNCNILYTEDMHHKLLIEDRLTIINPFK
ncbi:MAG: PIN domain-containing protein [Spirochaetota bacterium]